MDNGAGTTITNENFSLTDQVSAEANVVSDIWPTGLAGEDTFPETERTAVCKI